MSSPSQSLSDVHTLSTSNLNSCGETGEQTTVTEGSENVEVDVESQGSLKSGSQAKLNLPRDKKAGGDAGDGADDFESWMKSRQLIRPEDQLDLTEAELSEEVSKVLTAQNMNILKNLVIYSFKEGAYVPLPLPSNTVTLLSFTGTSLHIDSDAAKKQIEEMGDDVIHGFGAPSIQPHEKFKGATEEEGEEEEEEGEGEAGRTSIEKPLEGEDKEEEEDEDEEEEAGEEGEGAHGDEEGAAVDEEGGAAPAQSSRKKKLVNQFNFCERATLTYMNPTRCVETQTVPPPRSSYGATVLQWVIYDAYEEDFAAQQSLEPKKKVAQPGGKKQDAKKGGKAALAEELNRKYLKCWQILERMINQNIYDDIAQDYRYFEDPADEMREEEGNLLPLWNFQYEKTKKLNVTDLYFNPHYYDLLAVCFGNHDFLTQKPEGAMCCFSIKNPSFPDYIIMTESGVMCVDIHPKYPYLVAIGMYDGNVAIYNLQSFVLDPIYMSKGVNGKHGECVWEIKWAPDMPDGEINFYSVSVDGRVFNWILMQNELQVTTLITLFLTEELGAITTEGPDGTLVKLRGCGTCLTFHPLNDEVFMVGTEEGIIYKCSTAYSSKYLMFYEAHYLSVYRIDFNKYNPNIFASCGADWRVKIWEDMRPEPLFIFDLDSAVGDVKWAPYSSTVFAAVTTEGKVFVFDLNVNKYKAICVQAIVPRRKTKLTRLCFNQKLPFIIVGDDKGVTHSLKLSPNLRVMCKPPKKQPWLDQTTLQNQKLEKLLSLVRELPEGTTAPEGATVAKT